MNGTVTHGLTCGHFAVENIVDGTTIALPDVYPCPHCDPTREPNLEHPLRAVRSVEVRYGPAAVAADPPIEYRGFRIYPPNTADDRAALADESGWLPGEYDGVAGARQWVDATLADPTLWDQPEAWTTRGRLE